MDAYFPKEGFGNRQRGIKNERHNKILKLRQMRERNIVYYAINITD